MKAMAHQLGPRRGQSWSTGRDARSFPLSATQWIKSERLKKLEEDSRNISSQMKILEAEIRDLSTTFEKLKKFDAKRVEKLRELVDEKGPDVKKVPSSENRAVQNGEGLNGEEHVQVKEEAQVERSGEGKSNEEAESLKSEHEAAQSQIQYTKASLEQKRAELDALTGKHQTLTDQIAKEEKLASNIDESLQQSAAAQHDMRSLSEDLGRLGRELEGLEESKADPLKQSFTRPEQKPRVYHPVTQLRSRNHSRNFLNGGTSDLGRSLSLGDSPPIVRRIEPSRSKEPAEFQEREGGGNRKRHKNSSFELERERLREERAKLEFEKRRVLDATATGSLSSQSTKGNPSVRRSSSSSRDMSSSSSVSEGFGDLTPSTKMWLGSIAPGTSGSTGLSSDSSDPSSEFSTERPDSGSFSSAVKRLDFESLAKEDSVTEEIISRSPSEEDFSGGGLDHDVEVARKTSGEEPEVAEAEFEASSVEKGEEVLHAENGNEEFQVPAVSFVNRKREETLGTEVFSPESGTEAMRGLEDSPPKSGAEDFRRHSNVEIEGMQGAQLLPPESEIEEKRQPDVFTPESLTKDNTHPDSDLANFEREIPEVVSFTADSEHPDSELATFEREILEVVYEEFRNASRGRDAETDSSLHGADKDVVYEEFRNASRGRDAETDSSLHGADKDEGEEIGLPTEEFKRFRDSEENEGEGFRDENVIPAESEVEEIDVPEEDIEDFEVAEPAGEISEQKPLKTDIGMDEVEVPLQTSEVSSDDDGEDEATVASSPSVQKMVALFEQGSLKSVETQTSLSALRSPTKSGQWNGEEMSGYLSERHNRRLEAENQMMQLSSQLSILQKQVEVEVELHEKSKNDSQLQHPIEEKEQLSRQVSFFADEVRGLRENIDEIQRILHNEDGDLPEKEHWAKDLHSKCADQSAQLEHLGKQVSMLSKYLGHHLQLRNDIDKEAKERQKVEDQLTDLSRALAITVSAMEKEEEAVGEVIEHQKHLLVDQLKEAEKLRHIAEVRVLTLNNQIEQLEMVCDAAKNIQTVTKYQDKAFRQGLQALLQLFFLALGVITLYSRVAEPFRPSLVPT